MPNQWFRLYAEFATDPKVQMMSEANQRRFIMVLCLRCSNDDVTLHDEEVAFQLRISNEEWATTKALFLSKGLINENNTPAAWERRQFVSDSSAERVRRHRENKKRALETACNACNVTETPPEAEADTEAYIPPTPPTAREPRSGEFPMDLDWLPSEHFPTLARQAGIPADRITAEDLAEFRSYWVGQGKAHTQHQWDHKLLTNLKAQRARSQSPPPRASQGRRQPQTLSEGRAAAAKAIFNPGPVGNDHGHERRTIDVTPTLADGLDQKALR